jgi:hypothetical protein
MRKSVAIALVIVAIIAVIALVGANSGKHQDKSWNDGFSMGYPFRGSGDAQGQCNDLWNQDGQSADNQTLWIDGCVAGMNS